MYSLLVGILILTGVLIVGLFLLGIRPYVVQTESMTPAIPSGSVCFVNQQTDYDRIAVGDVIAFRVGRSTIFLHRAVAIDEYGITTKGDANNIPDNALVTRENFIGKEIFFIPEIGDKIGELRTEKGMLIFIVLIIVIIAGGFLLDRDKPKQKKPEQ